RCSGPAVLDYRLAGAGMGRPGARPAEAIRFCFCHRAGGLLLRSAGVRWYPGRRTRDHASHGRRLGYHFYPYVFYYPHLYKRIDFFVLMSESGAKSILRFDRVCVSFGGDPALKDISFEVLEADTRIILGAAGSGKTVLLKTAMGL